VRGQGWEVIMGYAKLYSFENSSLMELDVVIRFIFLFMLGAADFNGIFEGSPESLARRANVPLEDMRRALDMFQRPDPNSKSTLQGGRRLIYQGGNKWWLLNYVEYRTKRDDERSYQQMQWRLRKARAVARENGEELDQSQWFRDDALKQGTGRKFPGRHDYTDADTDTDTGITGDTGDADVCTVITGDIGGVSNTSVATVTVNSKPEVHRRRHVLQNPPTVEEIHEHILSKGVKANEVSLRLAQQILEHNEETGWRRKNGEKIYVWKSHVNQWIEKRWGGAGESGKLTPDVHRLFADQKKARAQEEKLREERKAKIAARVRAS
jgi:hypothetical protein